MSGNVALLAEVAVNRRRSLAAAGSTGFGCVAAATRRRHLAGAAKVDLLAAAAMNRRPRLMGSMTIDIGGAANLRWRYRVPAPHARYLVVSTERRFLTAGPDPRRVASLPRETPIVVLQPERA
ncbi:hypothetical protein GJR93_07245 [Aminobacter sp. MDW-2]|nr:hypothetical protein [Aminobacter sp. MDW-2]